MSIFFVGFSSVSPDKTKAILDSTRIKRSDVLRHFWISEPSASLLRHQEEAAEHNFRVESVFVVEWKKDDGSEFIPIIPQLLYEAFGKDRLLVFDLDRELVR